MANNSRHSAFFADSLPNISHGDHCCLFFSSPEEQAKITAPFLALGLERDERCVYVGDANSVDIVRQGLNSTGVNVEQEISRNRLILTSEQNYLDQGRWKTEKMLGFLQIAYDAAMADGYSALRAAGDVYWQVGPDKDFSDVVYYEALLDVFFVGKRMVGLCEYPKDKCPPDMLQGILNTHKIAAVDLEICSNFHHMPPELLLEKNQQRREEKRLQWMTSQLLRAKKAEEERDAIQEQFLHSQKMEAVGRLAGGVAHDFNNMLMVISGYTGMALLETAENSRLKSHLEEVQKAAERSAALTRQLLAFSRKQVLQPQTLNMNAVVAEMDKMLRRLIGEDIDLVTILRPDLYPVKFDPSQFEQIVMNLAVNAKDAMPEGGKLTIETDNVELDESYASFHADSRPGPHVMIAVTDTGSGMSAETKSKIFEPFFTTKGPGKGTGLGLATVYGIVKQSGGNIWVYSELGHGTTFKVYVPRAEPAFEAGKPKTEKVPIARGTERILLVEDEEAVRRLLKIVLESGGYTVLATGDVDEALRLCKEHGSEIDLLLTDVVLPKMGGPELAEKALILCPKLKVTFMSGYTDNAIVRNGVLGPGAAFIEKPVSPEVVLRKIREFLTSTRS